MVASIYKQLDGAKDLRILVLNSGHGRDEITCQLSSTSITAAPEYEALSYAWGDPNITRPIVCSDSPVQVTVNLHDALWHLRYPDCPRVLWVDAICINQQDTEEKNQQVGFMADIYSNAQQVLVWLGKAPIDFRDAFPFETIRGALEFIPLDEKKGVDLDRVKEHNWVPLLSLLQRPYFRQKQAVNTPSWIPQFDDTAFGDALYINGPRIFQAAGDSSLQARILDDKTTLCINGKAIDIIQELHGGLWPLPDGAEPSVSSLSSAVGGTMFARKIVGWLKLVHECHEIAIGSQERLSEGRLEEFCRTMVCDMWLRTRATTKAVALIADYLQLAKKMFEKGFVEYFNEHRLEFQNVESVVTVNLTLRRFCSSVNGRLGQATQNAKIGDIICIFFGGSVPYVIRPCGNDQYTFVGDCYLHGVMDGEALDMRDIEAQEFALR